MNYLGLSHFYSALLAILAGAFVIFRPKGTTTHKWAGRLYLAAMLAVNVTALLIYRLWGHFGPFHAAALISLLSVLMGANTAWRKKPPGGWRIAHAYWMTWSYVGLLAAAVAESATRYLDFDFGLTVGIASFAVIAAGALVINHRVPVILGMRKR